MAPRICGTPNKVALLWIILWSSIFLTFGVGIALAITVNPGILFIFVVLGLSLSTIALDSFKVKRKARHDVNPQQLSSSPGVCVAKLSTNAPSYAEENIIYPSSSTATNASDSYLCIEPNVTAMRPYSGSKIYSSDEWAGPITYVARGSATQLLPGPMDLLSVPIRPALPDLETSSDDSATCECVRSLSYHGPYSWYERRKGYKMYDLNSEESYNTSAGFVTLDTTEALYEVNLVRTPSKLETIANRSPEPKTVSWDMGKTGRTTPSEKVRKGDGEVRSDTSSAADENSVKPQIRPQETPVIATKVDAIDKVDIGKEGSSDISQEAEDKCSTEDTLDLQPKGSRAPSKVSLSPPGSRNIDRTHKGKAYKKDTSLHQVSVSDPKDGEDSTRPESEIAWVSLSTPTRRSGVLPGNETSETTDEQRLSLERDQPLDNSIQQELTMPFKGLNHSKPRSKSTAFSAGDRVHRDRRSHGISKSAHTVEDSTSQTYLTASRGGDRDEFAVAPLVKAEVVKVTVINSPLSEESSQESSAGPREPRKVTSCSEYVQGRAKMRNRALQSEERQAAPESPKKKRLTGRLSTFLRPRKRKQGITPYCRVQRSK